MDAPISGALRVSFDLFERYSTVGRIAPFFRPEPASRFLVLDAGGSSPLLWDGFTSLSDVFIPDSLNVTLDLSVTEGLKNGVSASGTALPFSDGAFDFVCSLDAL